MNIIKTKRHVFKFYVLIIFSFLLFLALGILMLHITIEEFQNVHIEQKDYFLPIVPVLFFFMAFFIVYTYWKNSPIIIIDPQAKLIKLGTESYYLNDIKNVKLTGKMPFKFILKFPMEGASIHFKNGITKYIYDDFYSNSWQLKTFLHQVIIKKTEQENINFKPIERNALRFEKEELFKGNPILSLRGISLWSIIGMFIWGVLFKISSPSFGVILFFIGLSSSWFVLHSWMMHYFGLTDNYFVIRNHNYILKQKIYRHDEIKEIVFDSQGQQPNCLRIITKDFKNKLYPAATLRDKTWLYLKERLESKNIKVRNECIYDKNAF